MDNAATEAVYSCLLPFWLTNTKAWFLQAEAQFTLCGITQDVTKHAHVITSLDKHTAATKVTDLLAASSAADNNKYAHLKQCLLECFQLSEQEQAQCLLELRGLGDRTIRADGRSIRPTAGQALLLHHQGALPPATPTHCKGAAHQHKLWSGPLPGHHLHRLALVCCQPACTPNCHSVFASQ